LNYCCILRSVSTSIQLQNRPACITVSVYRFLRWRHQSSICISHPVHIWIHWLASVKTWRLRRSPRSCEPLRFSFWAAFINLAAELSCKTVVSRQRHQTCIGVWSPWTDASACSAASVQGRAGQGWVSPCVHCHVHLRLVLPRLQNHYGRAFPLFNEEGEVILQILLSCMVFFFLSSDWVCP
jgi:hypothetical protein